MDNTSNTQDYIEGRQKDVKKVVKLYDCVDCGKQTPQYQIVHDDHCIGPSCVESLEQDVIRFDTNMFTCLPKDVDEYASVRIRNIIVYNIPRDIIKLRITHFSYICALFIYFVCFIISKLFLSISFVYIVVKINKKLK